MAKRRHHVDDHLEKPDRPLKGRPSRLEERLPLPGQEEAAPLATKAALQTEFLGDERLLGAQRFAVADQLRQIQGNRQLQRMVIALKGEAGLDGLPILEAIQRQDEEGNPFAPADVGTSIHPTVRYSSRGPAVEELQEKLNNYGITPPLVVDGIFGPKTRAAVVTFQQENGLSADGVVGPLTWGRIDELGVSSTVGRVEKAWHEEVGGQTYSMTSRYTWRITASEIRITVKLRFTGVRTPALIASIFDAIRSVWNRYQAVNEDTGEVLDITFDPLSVEGGEDNVVRLLPGDDRSDAGNWYVDDPERDEMVAHEFGHMLSLEDEYQRTHRDYKRLVGEEPEPGEMDGKPDPEVVADDMRTALYTHNPDTARVGPCNLVIAHYGLEQGMYSELVANKYEEKYGTGLVADIVARIPDEDEWDIVDPFTYSSGSIMGMGTDHDHPVEPRHLRDFVGYIQSAKGGTWSAQEK